MVTGSLYLLLEDGGYLLLEDGGYICGESFEPDPGLVDWLYKYDSKSLNKYFSIGTKNLHFDLEPKP